MAEKVGGETLGQDDTEEVASFDFFSGVESSNSAETFLSAKTRANMVKYLVDKVGQCSDMGREEIKE